MNNRYNSLIFIAMLYIAIDLSSMVFAYKIIEIDHVIGVASSLIFPVTYSIMDVLAEVYGYKVARKIICYGFICDLIFAIVVLGVSEIPSVSQSQTMVYRQIMQPLFRAVLAQMIGVLLGAFVNIYLISKWKMMTNGRFFWLRSIGSSTVGEGVMLVVSVSVALVGVLSVSQIYQMILYTYLYKVFFAVVAAPFVSAAAFILRNKVAELRSESIDFNPFDMPDNRDLSPNFQ